ncbi:MAG: cupin domain-containing protein [Pseudomonadota bacterium]
MRLNADFSKRVVVRPEDVAWTPSPMAGVERRMLDRLGAESGHATSIVRYAPGSSFSNHTHSGGEEFLVLDGVFSDQYGDFPAGTYVRNPIGTRHAPHSDSGCTIFVKLHQFASSDTRQFALDTRTPFSPGLVHGLSVLPLHAHGTEQVALVRWQAGTRFHRHRHQGGEEILVLEGTFQDEHGDYPAGTWLRSPHGSEHRPRSDEGCLIYVKTGHLTPRPPSHSPTA